MGLGENIKALKSWLRWDEILYFIATWRSWKSKLEHFNDKFNWLQSQPPLTLFSSRDVMLKLLECWNAAQNCNEEGWWTHARSCEDFFLLIKDNIDIALVCPNE